MKSEEIATMAGAPDLPQHVVVLTHEFHPKQGGIATHVEELSAALVELGMKVTVWAPAPRAVQREDAGKKFNFEVRLLRLRGSRHWRSRLKLAWHLLSDRGSWRNAVLYLPEPGPIRTWFYLQLIPGLLPSKLVITLHGSELEYLSRLPHRRILFHRLLRNADRIGVVSKFVNDLLLSRYPDIGGKQVLTYGAVRASLPPVDGIARPSKRASSSKQGKWTILTVARIHPRKGQLAAVEALGLLSRAVRNRISYRIVGPVVQEAYRDKILASAGALGVEVELTGPLTEQELRYEYAQADAFVMASMYSQSSIEGFGLVYLEAGTYALPVIAHDIGGVADAVQNGVTGILVPHDNRQALGDAIQQLFESPALCGSLGEAGRLHALEFSWSHAAQKLFSGL